jgi:hypothetical protein
MCTYAYAQVVGSLMHAIVNNKPYCAYIIVNNLVQ